jgi:hypothetical protein
VNPAVVMKHLRYAAFLLLVMQACSKTDKHSDEHVPAHSKPSNSAPSYHKDIRPIIEKQCLSCHSANGIGTFALTDYSSVKQTSAAIANSVRNRSMPPWLPTQDCRSYLDDHSLTQEEIQKIQDWHDAGDPEGNVEDYVNTSTNSLEVDLGPPSLELKATNSYTPRADRPDDYRCFLLSQTFDEETFLLTSAIEPDVKEQVHHVIVYLVEETYVDALIELENADSETGYQCFGGIGTGNPTFVSGWAPGNKVQKIDPKVAMRLPKGGRLVMQMHYNTLAVAPKPDHSTLKLWLSSTKPEYLFSVNPFPHFGIDIEPLDSSSKHSRTFRNNSDESWTVVATAPHMHLLGKEISVKVIHADGQQECLLDIDNWDFDWQQSYNFLPDEYVTVAPGDTVVLECVYDNSAENQPIINQQRQESGRVQWGEGTLDEMCLNYLITIEPYFELPEVQSVCENFQPCYDTCKQSFAGTTTGCALECAQRSGGDCPRCVVTGLVTCGITVCPVQTSNFVECLERCNASASPDCVRDECINDLLIFERCIQPVVDAGQCDDNIVACRVDL